MKRMYAPWRSAYTTQTARTKKEKITEKDCIFCKIFKQKKDTDNFIIKRTKHNVIILNRFPYNAGHILIMPLAHKATLDTLSKNSRAELMELISNSAKIIKKTLKADGVNIGLNMGKAAGAGIPSHLHFHILPRWFGDTNFLPTLTETKQISLDLNTIYSRLKKALK